jgi:hypothetical protein
MLPLSTSESNLPEWFPPAYAKDCRAAVHEGYVSMEWAREGVVLPTGSDFLFDPFHPQEGYGVSFWDTDYHLPSQEMFC